MKGTTLVRARELKLQPPHHPFQKQTTQKNTPPLKPQNSWLYSNKLTELPPEIGALLHLRRLWLERNKVRVYCACGGSVCCAWVCVGVWVCDDVRTALVTH